MFHISMNLFRPLKGRVLGVLGVSRAFGDIEFKGPGLEGFLRSSVEAKLLEKAFVECVLRFFPYIFPLYC